MRILDELDVGQECRVVNVRGEHTSLRRRLLDMGLTPDTKVVVRRKAPLNDPIELELRGYSLTIRSSDAHLIEVE